MYVTHHTNTNPKAHTQPARGAVVVDGLGLVRAAHCVCVGVVGVSELCACEHSHTHTHTHTGARALLNKRDSARAVCAVGASAPGH